MSILYSEPLRENFIPTFKIGDWVRILKYDLLCRKAYKSQLPREIFEILAVATRKPPTYSIKDENDEIFQGEFYQKELIKVN